MPHVDEPQADPAAEQHRLRTPAERLAAAVLAKLDSVDGDPELKAQILLVGDVRR